MSEIKAGDLVMVVRGTICCGHPMRIGMVKTALALVNGPGTCAHCGARVDPDLLRARLSNRSEDALTIDVSRLIRIDPPAQPESVETDREVVA